jgi:disulfide bond formation protein DsbB
MDAKSTSNQGWTFLFLAWVLTVVATLGSLFLSEVMGFPPCSLCWYQRIAMYPLVLILLMGLFPLETRVWRFAMPLAVVGWGIALYHILIQVGVIPESIQPCRQGVSCGETYLRLLGFVTIPMLSFVAFTGILALLFSFKMTLTRDNK